MATIRSSIVVQDMASSVFAKINSSLNKTNRGFRNLNNEMSVAPTESINNAEKLNASVKEQRISVQGLKSNYDNVSKSIKNSNDNQEKFNNSINAANTSSNKLLSTIKNIVVATGGITAIKGLTDLSDSVTSNRSRLELIVDDNGSVADLENKIFAMSNRTRADFLDTTSVISKLGILAGDNFKNTDEIIAFTELMNKNFAISGASIQEQTSAMYQLTQAMAAGKLQGDEFRSIMENAPLLAEAIAEYTGKSKGELKELSSKGLITADIIKNAMFSSADQINARYSKMPMTWGQIWTRMKNVAVKALDPVLVKINELANNQQVQEMFNMFIDGASLVAQAILYLIEGVSWLVNVLKPVAPIIFGIVGAYVAFNIISGITRGILSIMSFMQGIQAAASMMQTGATFSATAAQLGLNSALLACPITWIVILIMALIVALTYLWFTNDKVAYGILYVWDALKLGIMVAGLGIQGVFYAIVLGAMALWLGIQTCVLGAMGVWYAFQTGIEAVGLGILGVFQGLYNGVVWLVNRNNYSIE